jgi:glutamate decarboxylase
MNNEGKGQMTSSVNWCSLLDTSHDGIEKKLMQLFRPEDGEPAASRMATRLSEIAEYFLRARYISGAIDFECLAERFTDSSIPDEPADIESFIDHLDKNVIPYSTRTSSPLFIGHMTSSLPYFMREIARLVVAMNQNVVKVETAKALTPYERQAIAKVHHLIYGFGHEFYSRYIQRSDGALGVIGSGGTVANITALWCARNASLPTSRSFAGIGQEGMAAALDHYAYKRAVIIGSSQMHYSFDKAGDVLGIGSSGIVKIPTDGEKRIDLNELRRRIAECRGNRTHIIALVGNAGTTDCGAIDPLQEMAEIAREEGIHFHVDAAWGGPLLFSERHRRKLEGIEKADTVTIDGHKQLYLPLGIGMVIIRDPKTVRSIEKNAQYIVRAGSNDAGRCALEGSRPGAAIFLNAALELIGRKGYEFLIDEGIRKAQYMADSICGIEEFELLLVPQMNILLYRYIPEPWREAASRGELDDLANEAINECNKALQEEQSRAGQAFVSRTTIYGAQYGCGIPIVALRAVIANPLTTESDIDSVLSEQMLLAARLPATAALGKREGTGLG